MSASYGLQFYLAPSIEENLIFSHFTSRIHQLSPLLFSQENLDLKKFLIVIAPLSQSQEMITKFKYYRTKWFFFLNDQSEDSSAAPCDLPSTIDLGVDGFILELQQVDVFSQLVEKLKIVAKNQNEVQAKKIIQEHYLKVSQEASRYLDLLFNSFKYQLGKSTSLLEEQVQEMVDFFLERRNLLEFPEEKEIAEALNKKFQRWGIVGFQKINTEMIEPLFFEKEKRVILPSLLGQERDVFYVWDYEGLFDAKCCFTIYNLMLVLEKHTVRETRANEMLSEESLWENVFSAINFPMVLLSSHGDIIIHNNDFSKAKILPKDCLNFENESALEVGGATWIVHRRDISLSDEVAHLFIFQTNESDISFESSLVQDSSELGIVSGSIAHELNNPIGGILASLAVLELEDHWSNDSLSSLEEMKKGARRCKDLVEIFLGFSKSSLTSSKDTNLFFSLERALHLLRFRMIESGLRLEIEQKQTEQSFDKIVNSSIMAMFFYLLLNEVLTHFAHSGLVNSSEGSGRVLHVRFSESADSLSFMFSVDMSGLAKVTQSKLISHLLDLEGIDLEIRGAEISLYRKSLL